MSKNSIYQEERFMDPPNDHNELYTIFSSKKQKITHELPHDSIYGLYITYLLL